MLNQIIQSLGHEVVSHNKQRTTYKSPFNPNERTASFCTFQGDNGINWKDYATGEGGDMYKFLMMYFNIGFYEAKIKALKLSAVSLDVTVQHKKNVTVPGQKEKEPISSFNQQGSYEIKKVQPLQNKALLSYLSSRGISERVTVQANLKEVYYSIEDKRYFAIAFMNDKDGIEVRNAYFKGNLKAKAVTSIINNANQLKVFEGFMDYLSYLEIAPKYDLSDYLILNSVTLIDSAINVLKGSYALVELYLDNDDAGNRGTDHIVNILDGVMLYDKRSIYASFKDVNEYLLKGVGA